MPKLTVGDPFPDLLVEFIDSGTQKLSDVVNGCWTVLMFYRDEDCPLCHAYFDQVAERRTEIEEADVQLVAVSTDTAKRAATFRDQHALWFPVGFGLDLEVADDIDIYKNAQRGSFEPAFVVLDPERRIVHASIQSGPAARPPMAELIALVYKRRAKR